MLLPNLDEVIVPKAKIVDYLLSNSHRDGRHKAAFFQLFGYEVVLWERLRDDLIQHARHEVIAVEPSPFGTRYVIEGIITAPDGRTPKIRTVWFVENDSEFPRLATAYPAK